MVPEKKEKTVWQIAGGPISRSYADIFLKYGVGLIGAGDAGSWTPERSDEEFWDKGIVRRFASKVKEGDVFLLRSGMFSIVAVGMVASEYLYLNQFDDVNGWDLQHARRVRWTKLPEDYDFGRPVFGTRPSRFSRSAKKDVIDFADRFKNSPPTAWQTAPLPDLPAEEPALEDVPSHLVNIVAAAQDLYPLYWNRDKFGDHPSEDELIAHFIVPFFRAHGWPVELIAYKWRHIDLVLFNTLPRIPENIQFVVEAKRLGAGVEGAFNQARGYVESLGVLRDIIVADGFRYRLYLSKQEYQPVAYANLFRLKRSALNLFERLQRS